MSDVAGRSVLDLLSEKLDEYVWGLQEIASGLERGHDVDMEALAEMKGRAHGCAMALALVTNPYAPDVATVKAAALERWENTYDVPPAPDPGKEERRARRLARREARQSSRNG